MSGEYPKEFLEIVDGIKSMKIRGAALIGRKAAEALKIFMEYYKPRSADEFIKLFKNASRILVSTRPTAVSLPNAIRFVYNRVNKARERGVGVSELMIVLSEAVNEFIERSITAIDKIGEIGAKRIEDGDTVLTHCNSQAAISILKHAWEKGKNLRVYVTETRPRRQGLLTAKQLSEIGIPTTLIIDSAARYFMSKIDKVVVGADAVAVNGAVINKIGTSMIALAAHEARVRFMVAAETYKFSPETLLGELVKIEERSAEEVVSKKWLSENPRVIVRNPAFDVTPPEYIDLIITEAGVVSPFTFFILVKDTFGWFYGVEEPWS